MSDSHRQSESEKAWDQLLRPWWAKALVGGVMLALAVVLYNDLRAGERSGGERVGSTGLTRFLYDIGGVWLPVGVTVAFGLGFLAWAGVHLRRTVLTRGLESPLRAYASAESAKADDDAMPTGRAVYWAFYRSILIVWTMLHLAVVYVALKLLSIETTPEGMAFAAVATPTVAYVDLGVIARCLGWDEGPILDWRQRVTWIAAAGMSVALIATGTAAWFSAGRQEREIAAQKQAAADRQKGADLVNRPEMKAANEAIRRQNQIRREAADAGKPLTDQQAMQQYLREQRAKRRATTQGVTP